MRDGIDNKEKEVGELKQKINGLESDVAEGKTEKNVVEDWLRESENKMVAMESETGELERQIDESEKMITGLKNHLMALCLSHGLRLLSLLVPVELWLEQPPSAAFTVF